MSRSMTRRAALRASGIALTLPILESQLSRHAGGQSTPAASEEAPRRMVLICSTLGLHGPSLFPSEEGFDYPTTEYLKLLERHRKDFTLFSGLSHPDQHGKQPHDTEMTWLTSAKNPGMDGFRNSVSVDQVAAEALGNVTRFSSIALSSCTSKSQSYTSNGVMIPAEDRPSRVFEKLFLAGRPDDIRRQRSRLSQGQSILDFVAEQAHSVRREGSQQDRRQLDQYFEAIRSAESDLVEREAWLDRPKPEVSQSPPTDILDKADLVGRTRSLLKLVPLILQTDSSRVISMVIQDHQAVPKIDGVTAEHHHLSHHGQNPDMIRQLKRVETEILTCFADLLNEMSEATEQQHRLLDQTSILFGSNLGNANSHDPRNLPIFLAGGAAEHGQYRAFDSTRNTPLSNLFVSMLQQMDIPAEKFGSSEGTVEL